MQDWRQHKSNCTVIKKRYDLWKEDKSNVLPDRNVLDTKEGPCAICLEETIANPVSLPCGHEFCFECIGEYQHSANSDKATSCPHCRGEIPNVAKKAFERNTLYTNRALNSPKGSGEQKKYAKLALAEYDAAVKLFNEEDGGVEHLRSMLLRSMMAAMTGQPEETIKITNKTLSMSDKHLGFLNFEQVTQVKNVQAEAYSELGKWKDAGKIYTSIYEEYMRRRKRPFGNIFAGLTRALYMGKEYDKAVKIGLSGTTSEQRCYSEIHKYLALSQKALGDIGEAKITMKRAILYEERWNKDNLEKNKQLLRELNNH